MCYTIEINLSKHALENRFGAKLRPRDFTPRYVVSAFSLPEIPVIAGEGEKVIDYFRWGLIPSWTRDEQSAKEIRLKTFNARAETIAEKPAFRDSFRKRRCLVLVHGFFEWHEWNKKKYPFYIRLRNNEPFALAGIYDQWLNKETGELITTVSIVTTSANSIMQKIHNTKKRMPVILPRSKESEWIDQTVPAGKAGELLKPFDPAEMNAHAIAPINPSRGEQYQSDDVLNPFRYPELLSFGDL